jgi:hypothetical protein
LIDYGSLIPDGSVHSTLPPGEQILTMLPLLGSLMGRVLDGRAP